MGGTENWQLVYCSRCWEPTRFRARKPSRCRCGAADWSTGPKPYKLTVDDREWLRRGGIDPE